MNMLKNYDGSWDWGFIGFSSFVALVVSLIIFILISAADSDRKQIAEKHAYKAKCIDAGGAPVAPFDYVRGHGEGYLCINPSAIIEVD